LVGKIAPKSKTELTPEEKLLKAIFGRAGEDVKNDSLEVSSGVDGVVIDAEHYVRKTSLSEDERSVQHDEARKVESGINRKISKRFKVVLDEGEKAIGRALKRKDGKPVVFNPNSSTRDFVEGLEFDGKREEAAFLRAWAPACRDIELMQDERERQVAKIKRGDELPSGVLEMVKVYVAMKRNLSVGDKMAGRHGNKGVIAKILPEEDMPFLEDGTPLDMVLNPLGVPSRMNIGQLLETQLGWAAQKLGFEAVTPIFDGAREEEIRVLLKQAGLPESGKVPLFDGRTGEPFHQQVTAGVLYMLKLHHLVDDKIHARATGPYSLITQQPLGGKARFGGQRFGEMEVWALEAYGAAYILQELLTVKSDDVEGRTKIYEAIVKGENTLEAGTPVSFEVLTNEIKGLGLNIELGSRKG
ncbi:MAG: DNA-directed RNA polymerase subunit beta, partial [Planctomycetota bacterium]